MKILNFIWKMLNITFLSIKAWFEAIPRLLEDDSTTFVWQQSYFTGKNAHEYQKRYQKDTDELIRDYNREIFVWDK
jgi:hypothetical protein